MGGGAVRTAVVRTIVVVMVIIGGEVNDGVV